MWQPIVTAPKDGTHILVWDGYSQMVVRWGFDCLFEREPKHWIYGDSQGEFNDYQSVSDPTHWMPLPEPPE